MKRLWILTFISVVLAAGIYFLKKRSPDTIATGDGLVIKRDWLLQLKNPQTPSKDQRPADQTFLTFPEWFLVFSPEEQAQYFRHTTSTSFPFMRHTAQIWQSYKIVNDQIKNIFPTNTGYHFMIWVIGSSATIEYSVKAWYETVFGRLTDTHSVQVAEDRFNAQFTDDYVRFIKDKPWYLFDFKSQFKELWSATPLSGDHFLRKIERRYILSSELMVKYVYGKLIGLGSATVYDEALPTTAVVLQDNRLVYLPRYDRFAGEVMSLAKQGAGFKEIAGNNSAILLTLFVADSVSTQYDGAQTVFIQPVASHRRMKRIALAIPVTNLHKLLFEIDRRRLGLEHVFDF